LLAANERLLTLRGQIQATKGKEPTDKATTNPPWQVAELSPNSFSTTDFVSQLPSHLGWGTAAATQAIRTSLAHHRPDPDPAKDNQLKADHPSFRSISNESYLGGQPLVVSEKTPIGSQLRLPLDGDSVKHYPSIGIAALKEDQSAIYRVWLMCRYLDVNGRGWLPVQEVREQLTGKKSKLRLFCWRRLRQVLGQGHGRFWQWDKAQGRVWFFGAASVAVNLDVARLSGKPVALPVKSVTKSIGEFKAHLYGAWHSGRKTNNPISREVQQSITSIPERTQRHYCKVAGIHRQTNIAIGNRKNPEEAEKQAWQRGRATFEFVDHQGRQGRKGTYYIAWHLPNSYTGPHQQSPKGRMRKINRKLNVLVTKGAQGNGGETVEKLYFANGKDAGRALRRDVEIGTYWPLVSESRNCNLWAVFFGA